MVRLLHGGIAMDEQARQVRDTLLQVTEEVLEAQLRAVRSLRGGRRRAEPKAEPGMSQVDMAYDILRAHGTALHIGGIIEAIAERFGAVVDRESLVSALSKRVARSDRFRRVGPNVFGVIGLGEE